MAFERSIANLGQRAVRQQAHKADGEVQQRDAEKRANSLVGIGKSNIAYAPLTHQQAEGNISWGQLHKQKSFLRTGRSKQSMRIKPCRRSRESQKLKASSVHRSPARNLLQTMPENNTNNTNNNRMHMAFIKVDSEGRASRQQTASIARDEQAVISPEHVHSPASSPDL